VRRKAAKKTSTTAETTGLLEVQLYLENPKQQYGFDCLWPL
jgi:hypothetical protein